jgi:hypothetical protein
MYHRALPVVVPLLVMVLGSAAGAAEVWGVPATEKVKQDQAPGASWTPGKWTLDCARNESEAFQVVLRDTGEGLREVTVQLTDLQGPDGAVVPVTQMRLYRVDWVDINAPYEIDKPSDNPDFRPDPLVPVRAGDQFSRDAGRNLVFWIAVAVPESARPGQYQGQIRLSDKGRPLTPFTAQLRVRSFALPRRPLLQSMVGFSAGNLCKAHGCKTDADKEALLRLFLDEYIRARLSPFLYAPGNQAFNPLPDGAIKWTFARGADGKPTGEFTLDFTGFDREAKRYLDDRQAFSSFNFAPYMWVRRDKQVILRFADSTGTAIERRNPDGSLNPVFDQLVVGVFRGIAAHLAEKGWLDRAIYYVIDEPAEADTPAIKEICELVRQADPRIRTSLTYDPASRPRLKELVDEKGRSLISVWVPYCTGYREDVAADQRQKGADYWLYDVSTTCLIGHSAQTNRSMFWDIWRRGAHGYLYYLSTWWGRDATPWERPSFLLPGVTYRYRQGDGYFFYPPLRKGEPEKPILDYVVPTIRWEMLREGAEDYDYLAMLQDLTQRAEKQKLEVAAEGWHALTLARDLSEVLCGVVEGVGIRDLTFPTVEGWSFGLEEGWLTHRGGKRSDLPITFHTKLPDGRYQLVLNVYDDKDYRGRPYSRFLVDGSPYASPGSGVKSGTDVVAGTVQVVDGQCRFTLSSVPEDFGVILYRAGLKRLPPADDADLYAVRARISDAIEHLQAALR